MEQAKEILGGLQRISSEPQTLSEPRVTWLRVCLEQLIITAQLFRAEMDEAGLEAYRQALGDLTEAEITLACETARKKHREFMPTPAQLREYLAAARAEMPAVKAADCGKCGGSGWYLPAGRDTARRCKHEAI